MTRFLRLGYVIPRLVLLVVLFCVAEYGSGWLLRHTVIDGGQQAVGARIELGEANVSLLGARATLRDLRVANPQRPMENLFEAERLELDFEADSLLRRKAIAERGSVRGLRFGTQRDTTGALDPNEAGASGPLAPAWLTDQATDLARQAADRWIADLQQKISLDAAQDLASVRLAEELSDKWPARYSELRDSAETLRSDVEAFAANVKEARSNPLRNAEDLAAVPQRVASLNQRLKGLRAELATLPAEVAADRQRIAAARVEDERLLRQRLSLQQLDPDSLTTYLLGEQVTAPVRELIGWVRWTRQMIPAKTSPVAATPRDRGVDIHFPGVRRRPDLLVRSLDLDGVARLAGRPVELSGVVTDFTTSPELHGAPMRVVMQTSGALPLEVKATIDRTGPSPADELIVDCQGLDLPRLELGDAERLGLVMAPSTASLSIHVDVTGERLSGELRLVQPEVRLDPTLASVGGGRFGQQLREAIGEGVARLPNAATRVTLAGTLDRPELGVTSTLGPAVAEATQNAVRRLGKAEADRLLADTRRRVDASTARLDQLLAEATSEITAQIRGPQQEIERLAGDWLGTGSFSFEQLGKRLPGADSLFR